MFPEGWNPTTGIIRKCDAPITNVMLLTAYREFESRAGLLTTVRGAKTSMVMDAIDRLPDGFKMVDLERACPNVTREMIRVVLNRLKTDEKIHCEGFGGAAIWKKGPKCP